MSTDADTTPTERTIVSDVDGTADETVVTGPMAVRAGTVLEGRWKVDSNIASGGYGDVWRGEDLERRRPIALKILRHNAGNNDPSAIARMRQEAEILKAIQHQNIVKVYGFGDSAYGHFLAMEFLDGEALDRVLDQQGPAASERVIPIAAQLLSALAEAHNKGILHRDIKPENIILVPGHDGRELAKLVDFGIAKAQRLLNDDEEGATLVQTRAGGFMGTPRYAAPEQAVGDPIGPTIDLFALGLVIAEWLTGRRRIDGKRHSDVMSQLLSPDELDISDVPYRWQKWLRRMIAKNPASRYQSAAEALADLTRLVVELHKKADFLDDDPNVFSQFSEGGPAQDGSFMDDDSPLELDYDRVRKLQKTPAALGLAATAGQGHDLNDAPQGPPDDPYARPRRRDSTGRAVRVTEQLHGEKPSAAGWFNTVLWLVALVIIAFGVVVGVLTLIK
jgi:serine/threonine protein kinase